MEKSIFKDSDLKYMKEISLWERFLLLFIPEIKTFDIGDEGTCRLWTKELFGRLYLTKIETKLSGTLTNKE